MNINGLMLRKKNAKTGLVLVSVLVSVKLKPTLKVRERCYVLVVCRMVRRTPHTPRRLRRRGRGALNVLLMSVPPLFNIALVSFLSYYTVHHNNDSVNYALLAAFIDAQLLFNWIQFLRNQSVITPSKKNFPGKLHFAYSITDQSINRP